MDWWVGDLLFWLKRRSDVVCLELEVTADSTVKRDRQEEDGSKRWNNFGGVKLKFVNVLLMLNCKL